MYRCIDVCMYIYLFMYICIYVYLYLCIYVYMNTCIYVYMNICIFVYMYICVYVYICIYIYMYIYICIYMYIYMSLRTCCSCAHMYAHMPMPMVAFRFSADASGARMLQLRPHNRIVCSGCSAQTFLGLLPVHARQIQSAWKHRKLCNIACRAAVRIRAYSIDSGCSARTYVFCLLTVPAVQHEEEPESPRQFLRRGFLVVWLHVLLAKRPRP